MATFNKSKARKLVEIPIINLEDIVFYDPMCAGSFLSKCRNYALEYGYISVYQYERLIKKFGLGIIHHIDFNNRNFLSSDDVSKGYYNYASAYYMEEFKDAYTKAYNDDKLLCTICLPNKRRIKS